MTWISALVPLLLAAAPGDAQDSPSPELRMAGPLTFGPDGVLFIGDPRSAAIFALDTEDTGPRKAAAVVGVEDLGGKIAALYGIETDELLIHDLAVNPLSGKVYVSGARGRGPDGTPVLVTVDAAGGLEDLYVEDYEVQVAQLPNAPADQGEGRRNQRTESITDLAFVDGRLFVAGLSNEEFASKLRSIPWPFTDAVSKGSSVEIYHGAHGALETRAPVRTFAPYELKSEPHLLAAYTCTPLVKFPIAQLEPDAKVRGTTLAELGNRNRPLDMIVYQKGGEDFVLMSNSSRGMMKIPMAEADAAAAITEPVSGGGTAGLGYETLEDLRGVVQMDGLDAGHAVILVQREGGQLDLITIALP